MRPLRFRSPRYFAYLPNGALLLMLGVVVACDRETPSAEVEQNDEVIVPRDGEAEDANDVLEPDDVAFYHPVMGTLPDDAGTIDLANRVEGKRYGVAEGVEHMVPGLSTWVSGIEVYESRYASDEERAASLALKIANQPEAFAEPYPHEDRTRVRSACRWKRRSRGPTTIRL